MDDMRARTTAVTVLTCAAVLATCMGGGGSAAATTSALTVTPTTQSPAQEVFARMTEDQRVGQLFMVGTPATGVSAATASAITNQHVGSVILTGRSSAGVSATRSVTTALQARATSAATAGVPLAVAADQEGGAVQVLKGTGFSTIPSALTQGGWSAGTLRSSATTWGRQLRSSGVNVNLAPVADTVPSAQFAPRNAPIGAFDREFGYTPSVVGAHAQAFAQGMRAATVMPSVKHFPGLGRVTANTDTTSGVKDATTTRTDAYLAPFRTTVAGGAEMLMLSSAIYTRIDSANPAVFSSTVVDGMVRHDLDFRGVVVSDDLGNARQVAAWAPGTRAVKFIAAGGDLVLTVNPDLTPAMVAAVKARMAASATFRSQVHAAALRVLTVKQRMGLIRPNGAIRATDVDEDGAADVMSLRSAGVLQLVRGNDRAGWRPRTNLSAGFGFADLFVPAGDFDTDTHPDVLARRRDDGALMLYPGNGRGGLRPGRVVNRGWGGFDVVVAPGDMDGDGHPDLLARDASGVLWLYRGTGAGGLLSGRTAVSGGWGDFDSITAVGDFDRSGTPDVMVRQASTGYLFLYRGNGAGGFASRTHVNSGWRGLQVLGPGDFDGDGRSDLLTRSGNVVRLYPGTGSTLRAPVTVGTVSATETLIG